MLETDKNACQVLEEAKENARVIIEQAKIKAEELVNETKSDLRRNHELLKKKLFIEAEKKVDEVIKEKNRYLEEIEKHGLQCRKQLLEKLKQILFDNL